MHDLDDTIITAYNSSNICYGGETGSTGDVEFLGGRSRVRLAGLKNLKHVIANDNDYTQIALAA